MQNSMFHQYFIIDNKIYDSLVSWTPSLIICRLSSPWSLSLRSTFSLAQLISLARGLVTVKG